MVRLTTLVLAMLGTLGLAATPNNAIGMSNAGSEAVSAFMTGACLLAIGAVARRASMRKE